MRAGHWLIWVAATLAPACATSSRPEVEPLPREMVHDCSEILKTPLGEFRADSGWLHWTNVEDEMRIQFANSVVLEPYGNHTFHQFAGLSDWPDLLIRFSDRFQKWDWLGRGESHILEARIGDRVMREEVPGDVSVHFNSGPTWDLFKAEGDLVLTLTKGDGAVLQQYTVTRARLLLIEETFRELQARVIRNLADKEHRCKLVPKPVVVIT